MITLSSAELAELEKSTGIVSRTLIWVTAKTRDTGTPVSLGLWSGNGTRSFTIGGASRSYVGPRIQSLPPIKAGLGLQVHQLSLPITNLTEEVREALLTYDARFAPVEIHQALFKHDTRALLAEPRRIFKGWIDQQPIQTGAAGGDSSATLVLVSAARALTRKPPLYQSDADQRQRDTDDAFRLYSSGAVLREVPWGSRNVRSQEGAGGNSWTPPPNDPLGNQR
ncbi:hypothetical protein [Pararhodobacter marinus]|uniref:hypothetical protein n=1 Tax=Pararhodobacter marinus TaxID=2184063 RepID=UPI003515B25D